MQDIPIVSIPINKLINTNAWTIDPWQNSVANVYCQASEMMTISYSSDGFYTHYKSNNTQTLDNETIYFQVDEIFKESYIDFIVTATVDTIAGLKCSIYFEEDVYNTAIDSKFWSVESTFNQGNESKIIVEQDSLLDNEYYLTDIDNDAIWIWNKYGVNTVNNNNTNGSGPAASSITFRFSFEYVNGIQNKPQDDCASISYYTPNKWKTTNCQEKLYFICNTYDHKPEFQESTNGKFALLMDRKLTQAQSNALCQNI